MFYDLADPHPFVQDLYQCLDDDGLLVLQMSYTPLMIQQLAFDNICHEHVYYYDLTSINRLFSQHGFKIVDCSLNDTNGGSFRISLQKVIAKDSSFGSAPLRDVCRMRVGQVFEFEKSRPISDPKTWTEFGQRLERLKADVVNAVREAKAAGKTVYGYGASTKGNTLLQYFGLDNQDIVAIAERSPYKFGLKTVGTNIPIISEEEMRAAKPDYLLVLPWHFIDEFEKRETEFFAAGGKMIVPCPVFKVLG
jgi:NDP-4-keto-2,6-dideoxyhexose 3-C-methyltransferase